MIDNVANGTAIGLELVFNPIVVNIDAYNLEEISNRNRLDYMLEVWVFDGANFILATEMEAKESPVETAGGVQIYQGAWFDISGVLKGFVGNSDMKIPDNGIIQQPDLTMQYYTVLRILLDDAEVFSEAHPTKWAYAGGISKNDLSEFSQGEFFREYIGEGRRFLSYKPDNAEVYEDAPEFLSWLNNYGEDNSTLYLNVWADEENGGLIKSQPLRLQNALPMAVYSFGVGPAQLDLDTETLRGYRVFLSNGAFKRVSEVRTYIYKGDEAVESVVFKNSLGVPVSLTCIGETQETVNFTREVGERFSGYSYNAILKERAVDKVKGTHAMVLRLGYYRDNYGFLADMGLSKEVFIWKRNRWKPLIPQVDALTIRDDSVWDIEVEMGFEMANEDETFSQLAPAALPQEQATAWMPFRAVCDLDAFGRYYGKLRVLDLVKYYTETGENVKPIVVKANLPGTEGFVDIMDNEACQSDNTPFFNSQYIMTGRFFNKTCATGLVGDKPTIIIPQDRWGSTVSTDDANRKAENEAKSLDTQEYANIHGPCNTVGVYDPGVIPAGRWWIKTGAFTGEAALSGISVEFKGGESYRPGNMWYQNTDLQPNQEDVFLYNRFNRHFPVTSGGPNRKWQWVVYGLNGKTLRFFRNGLAVHTHTVVGTHQILDFPVNPADQDKWYVDWVS